VAQGVGAVDVTWGLRALSLRWQFAQRDRLEREGERRARERKRSSREIQRQRAGARGGGTGTLRESEGGLYLISNHSAYTKQRSNCDNTSYNLRWLDHEEKQVSSRCDAAVIGMLVQGDLNLVSCVLCVQ
jgi:hypothetical protein